MPSVDVLAALIIIIIIMIMRVQKTHLESIRQYSNLSHANCFGVQCAGRDFLPNAKDLRRRLSTR